MPPSSPDNFREEAEGPSLATPPRRNAALARRFDAFLERIRALRAVTTFPRGELLRVVAEASRDAGPLGGVRGGTRAEVAATGAMEMDVQERRIDPRCAVLFLERVIAVRERCIASGNTEELRCLEDNLQALLYETGMRCALTDSVPLAQKVMFAARLSDGVHATKILALSSIEDLRMSLRNTSSAQHEAFVSRIASLPPAQQLDVVHFLPTLIRARNRVNRDDDPLPGILQAVLREADRRCPSVLVRLQILLARSDVQSFLDGDRYGSWQPLNSMSIRLLESADASRDVDSRTYAEASPEIDTSRAWLTADAAGEYGGDGLLRRIGLVDTQFLPPPSAVRSSDVQRSLLSACATQTVHGLQFVQEHVFAPWERENDLEPGALWRRILPDLPQERLREFLEASAKCEAAEGGLYRSLRGVAQDAFQTRGALVGYVLSEVQAALCTPQDWFDPGTRQDVERFFRQRDAGDDEAALLTAQLIADQLEDAGNRHGNVSDAIRSALDGYHSRLRELKVPLPIDHPIFSFTNDLLQPGVVMDRMYSLFISDEDAARRLQAVLEEIRKQIEECRPHVDYVDYEALLKNPSLLPFGVQSESELRILLHHVLRPRMIALLQSRLGVDTHALSLRTVIHLVRFLLTADDEKADTLKAVLDAHSDDVHSILTSFLACAQDVGYGEKILELAEHPDCLPALRAYARHAATADEVARVITRLHREAATGGGKHDEQDFYRSLLVRGNLLLGSLSGKIRKGDAPGKAVAAFLEQISSEDEGVTLTRNLVECLPREDRAHLDLFRLRTTELAPPIAGSALRKHRLWPELRGMIADAFGDDVQEFEETFLTDPTARILYAHCQRHTLAMFGLTDLPHGIVHSDWLATKRDGAVRGLALATWVSSMRRQPCPEGVYGVCEPIALSSTMVIEQLGWVAFAETEEGEYGKGKYLRMRLMPEEKDAYVSKDWREDGPELQHLRLLCDIGPSVPMEMEAYRPGAEVRACAVRLRKEGEGKDAAIDQEPVFRLLRQLREETGKDWVMPRYIPAEGNTEDDQTHYCVFEPCALDGTPQGIARKRILWEDIAWLQEHRRKKTS